MRKDTTGRLAAAWILILLLAAVSGRAHAAEQKTGETTSTVEDPARKQPTIQSLTQQLELLQKQMEAVQKQLEALQGQQAPGSEDLQQQVELLRKQLEAIQKQLQDMQAQQEEAKKEAERERLKQAAAAAAAGAGATGETGEVNTGTTYVSGTRMQPQLNPEISITGDMYGIGGTNEKERFSEGEWELDVQSYLDPYSRVHLVLSKPEDDSVDIEEGYVTWMNLPGSTTLTLGRKRQQFGLLNRWHRHAYDQWDAPLVLQESFGEEGLKGTGLSADWLMPHLWATTNELTVEVMGGDNEVAFAGADWKYPSVLARLKSYWDLTKDSYLEIGLNELHGNADPNQHLNHDFQAMDFTYNWYPAGRELYRDFTLRGMVLFSTLDRVGMPDRRAWGGYVYGQFKFTPHWTAGLRFDRVEDQRDDGHDYWGLSPYVTFWQSEFVRLRAQGSYRDDNLLGVDRRFILQLTVAAGPHKHETY